MRAAVSIRNKKLYQGTNNPFYGKQHSSETIEKLKNKHVFSKLSEDNIKEIKTMGENKVKHKVIMEKFNICRSTVSGIINNNYKRRDFNV